MKIASLLVLFPLGRFSMVSASNIHRNDIVGRQILAPLVSFANSIGSDLGITSTEPTPTLGTTTVDVVTTPSSSTTSTSTSTSTSKTTKSSSTSTERSTSTITSTLSSSSISISSSSSTTSPTTSSSTSTSTSSTSTSSSSSSSATTTTTIPPSSNTASSSSSISTTGIAIAAVFGALVVGAIIFLIFKFSPAARGAFTRRQDRRRAERSYRRALDGSDGDFEEGMGMVQTYPTSKGVVGIGMRGVGKQEMNNESQRPFSFAFQTSATYMPPAHKPQREHLHPQHYPLNSNPTSNTAMHSRSSEETLVSPISRHSSISGAYAPYKPTQEVRASRIGLAIPLRSPPRPSSVQDKSLPPLPVAGSFAGGRPGEGSAWDGQWRNP